MIILKYGESSVVAIDLTDNGQIIINATDLLKNLPGKTVNDFLNENLTQNLINQLKTEKPDQELTKEGSSYCPGLWMIDKLALLFAIWLDFNFYSWLIEELEKYILVNHRSIERMRGN